MHQGLFYLIGLDAGMITAAEGGLDLGGQVWRENQEL